MEGSDTDAEWDTLLNLGSFHARKLGMRPHDVEECADAFRLHMFCKHPELFAPSAPSTSEAWLHTCARNYVLNYRRQMARRCEHCVFLDVLERIDSGTADFHPRAQDPLEIMLKHEERQRIRLALTQLPSLLRQVIQGYYFAEIPAQVLADRADCSLHAIHVRLSRARQALRRVLREDRWRNEADEQENGSEHRSRSSR